MNEAQDEIVLAVLLRYPEEAPQLRLNLPPECLLNPVMAAVYVSILDYVESAGTSPTPEILKAKVTKGRMKEAPKWGGVVDRIFAIKDVDEHRKHLSFFEGVLQEQWMATQVKNTMAKTLDLLDNNQVPEAVRALQEGTSVPGTQVAGADIASDFALYVSDYEKRRAHPELYAGINIGLPSIDAQGGHHSKELWCMVGGAGVGKSLFLGQVAVNVAKQKKRLLLVTVENDLRSYMLRLYSNLCGVKYKHLKNSRLEPDEMMAWLKGMGKLHKDFCLKVAHFPDGCCARDIAAYMRTLKEPMDYLVVDQITNMMPNRQADFRSLDFRWFFQIALELKRLGDTCNHGKGIPLLTAIHAAGGTVDKKELTTDDIALAKAIGYHVHANFFITKSDGAYHLGASKFRDGKIETFPVFPYWEFWRLSEEAPAAQWGKTIDELEEEADFSEPDPEPESIAGETFNTDFDPVKIEAAAALEAAEAQRLNALLEAVPDTAGDEESTETPPPAADEPGIEV
jgi:replicative DNA helicase